MLDSLYKLHERVNQNKKNKKNQCGICPLVRDHSGPVFFEHEGESYPKVMIISESPAGFDEIGYNFSRLNELKEKVLTEIKTFDQWKKIAQLNTLGKFLAGLTDNRMVLEPKSLATINNIYWKHAVKCFIQRKGESVRNAKKRLRYKFGKACKYCADYLWEEIEIVKPDLIVLIGDSAFNAIFPKKKDIIGKSIKFPELIYIYHPNARIKSELKKKGFNYVKERIKSYL